jgi:hypothetical protein
MEFPFFPSVFLQFRQSLKWTFHKYCCPKSWLWTFIQYTNSLLSTSFMRQIERQRSRKTITDGLFKLLVKIVITFFFKFLLMNYQLNYCPSQVLIKFFYLLNYKLKITTKFLILKVFCWKLFRKLFTRSF